MEDVEGVEIGRNGLTGGFWRATAVGLTGSVCRVTPILLLTLGYVDSIQPLPDELQF